MTSIIRRTGTEGPKHDPYSYTEFTITRPDGRTAKVHMGLAMWVEYQVPGMPKAVRVDGYNGVMDEALRLSVGITYHEAEDALERMEQNSRRKHRAHGGTTTTHGFAGETMEFCKCGELLSDDFHIGMIE